MEQTVINKLKELYSQWKLYKSNSNAIDWFRIYEIEREIG